MTITTNAALITRLEAEIADLENQLANPHCVKNSHRLRTTVEIWDWEPRVRTALHFRRKSLAHVRAEAAGEPLNLGSNSAMLVYCTRLLEQWLDGEPLDDAQLQGLRAIQMQIGMEATRATTTA